MCSVIQNSIDLNELDIVIYHHKCQDGRTGAYLFKYECEKLGREILLIPATHDDPTLIEKFFDIMIDKNIIMVDVTTPNVLEIEKLSKQLIVLDHHETAMKSFSHCPCCTYNMDKSGSMMAFDYIYASLEPPMFIKCIDAYDRWDWSTMNTDFVKNFTQGYLYEFYNKDYDEYDIHKENPFFTTFKRMMDDDGKYFEELYNNGKKINEKIKLDVIHTATSLVPVTVTIPSIGKKKFNVIITKCKWELINELGSYCMRTKNIDFFVAIKNKTDLGLKLSLRSINGKTDLSTIGAKGHPHSACLFVNSVNGYFKHVGGKGGKGKCGKGGKGKGEVKKRECVKEQIDEDGFTMVKRK